MRNGDATAARDAQDKVVITMQVKMETKMVVIMMMMVCQHGSEEGTVQSKCELLHGYQPKDMISG